MNKPNPLHQLRISPAIKRKWERFLAQWDDCRRCPLSKTRYRVIHAGGVLPCNVLVIGEAPGKQEDSSGYPFVGRSGQLLREHILPEVWKRVGRQFDTAFINVIGCAPYRHDEEDNLVSGTPAQEEIDACHDHLSMLIHFAAPKAVLLLGKTAAKSVSPHVLGRIHGSRSRGHVPVCALYHPSYLLRTGGKSSVDTRRTILYATEYIQTQLKLPR